jgi:hypothetical protein
MSGIDLARDDVQVRVISGSENNPTDPVGRIDVTLTRDAVEVSNRHRGKVQTWRARPRPQLAVRLRQLLVQAHFPAQPEHTPPAGDTIYALRVEAGGAGATVMVPASAFRELPAWKAVFDLCDVVARQASGGVLIVGGDDELVWVD